MKNKATPPADSADEAIAKALEAAALATEAAHEAEAALAARSEAAQTMDRTARRSSILAAVAGGSAVLVLALGAVFWMRSSADLHDAGEVQAAASMAFVERLAEMNAALDRLDQLVLEVKSSNEAAEARMVALVDQVGVRVTDILTEHNAASRSDPALLEQMERLRAEVLESLAETQITLKEKLLAAQPPALAPKAAAPVQAPTTATTAPPKSASKSTARPAQRPASMRKEPNPFRFP